MLRIRPRDSDFDLVNFISIDFEMKGCMYVGQGERKGMRKSEHVLLRTLVLYIHTYMHTLS